ncbi:MAG: metalloprotease TldD [Deltaproteobacteria bacterium]|nr:metalloprotease TldD [Deltaproteobacteria bacterium]
MEDALVDPTFLSRLIGRALAHGGTFADVYVQKRRSVGIELDNGEVRSASTSTQFGVGIRVVKGAAVAFAHSDDLSEDALFACADAVSHIGGAEEGLVIAKPLLRSRPHAVMPSESALDVALEERLSLLLRGYDAAKAADARIDKVFGGYADVDETVLIANSDGAFVQDQRALCRLSLRALLSDGDKKRVGSWGGGSRIGVAHFENQSPESIAEEAVRQAVAQIGARPAPVGEQVVVVGPGSSGVLLHEAVGHGLEADFIRKKTSLFAGLVGESVASELCTIVDDGTLPGLRGSLNVDDEGTPTQRNVLIEKGVLKGFMNDRHNAELLGVEPSGNGRRQSFRHPPVPRMTNTFMEAGEDDPEEILKSVKNGLYCRAFGGGQVDIANGNFVFEVQEGYLIEDGKITAPVEGASLVGSGKEALSKITRVGSDAELDPGIYTCGKAGQSVPVGVGLPTLRLDGITVGGKGGDA